VSLDISPVYRITSDTECFSEKPQFPGSCTAISGLRYYNPNTGRWLSRDPLNEIGSRLLRKEYGRFNYREDSNLYLFIGNNPILKLDINGLIAMGNVWADGYACAGQCPGVVGPSLFICTAAGYVACRKKDPTLAASIAAVKAEMLDACGLCSQKAFDAGCEDIRIIYRNKF
jgi:RHS repeat-associated protein